MVYSCSLNALATSSTVYVSKIFFMGFSHITTYYILYHILDLKQEAVRDDSATVFFMWGNIAIGSTLYVQIGHTVFSFYIEL